MVKAPSETDEHLRARHVHSVAPNLDELKLVWLMFLVHCLWCCLFLVCQLQPTCHFMLLLQPAEGVAVFGSPADQRRAGDFFDFQDGSFGESDGQWHLTTVFMGCGPVQWGIKARAGTGTLQFLLYCVICLVKV